MRLYENKYVNENVTQGQKHHYLRRENKVNKKHSKGANLRWA